MVWRGWRSARATSGVAIYRRGEGGRAGCRRARPAKALATLIDYGEARGRDEGGADELQRSRRRAALEDMRRKKPLREQRRSVTNFPWTAATSADGGLTEGDMGPGEQRRGEEATGHAHVREYDEWERC